MLRVLVISLFVVNLLLFGFWDRESDGQQKSTDKPVNSQNSNVPTIHLFSEMMEDQGLLSDNRQCFSLGPFHSVDDLDEVYASLVEVTVTISERQTQALVEKGYWAYLPPYSSLLEANEVLLSLQALGMKDIAVIYSGEWTNAISLGYFLRQGNAVRRKESLDDRGYVPLIRVQRQAEDRYWLDYEQTPGSDMIALNMQDRPNDFMQRSLPCPEREEIEEVVAKPVEQVATVVQKPEPEPVEIPEDAPVIVAEPEQDQPQSEEPQSEDPIQEESQQQEDDITTQEDTEQPPEDVVSVPPQDADPQENDTDNTSSDEAEQQPDEIGGSIAEEEEPVQEAIQDVVEEAADTTSELNNDPFSTVADDQLPTDAEPASEVENEDAQLDSSAGLPVTIDDETIEAIITDGPSTESEGLEFEDYLLEQNPETDPVDDDGTGPETDTEAQPEPADDFDPYDGDEIEIDAG